MPGWIRIRTVVSQCMVRQRFQFGLEMALFVVEEVLAVGDEILKVTEVYYPTVDRPQLRDLQYLITDGKNFFHDEKRHLKTKLEPLPDHGLGYHCTNSDPAGHYAIVK